MKKIRLAKKRWSKLTVIAYIAGCVLLAVWMQSCSDADTFRAGEDSLRLNMLISEDEVRGEIPEINTTAIKKHCWELLQQLRQDKSGLKPGTERNIESYFTVADAFEADGLLVQAVDYLTDLEHKLEMLTEARAGNPHPHGLIETEDDILHFRDAHNIHTFDNKYMAGAQPTEKGYRWLKSKGVTTIINLRLPSAHEKELLEELDIEYVHIPWSDEQAPTVEQVNRMLNAVKNAEGKVLQHCLRGIGRDMTMASCYMMVMYDKPAEDLIREGRTMAPRWESDQKKDSLTGEPVQFKLLRDFEAHWNEK